MVVIVVQHCPCFAESDRNVSIGNDDDSIAGVIGSNVNCGIGRARAQTSNKSKKYVIHQSD